MCGLTVEVLGEIPGFRSFARSRQNAFFSGGREDDARRFCTLWSSKRAHEALHCLIAARETVVGHLVLPDRLTITSTPCFSEKGAIKSGVTVADFASESGVTRMAGFAGARRPHAGRLTTTPADFRYALAVSLRTPVACSMRRKVHPSFPSAMAMTCCFFSSLKTLLMPKEPIRAPLGVNVPGPYYGRSSADPTWPDLGDP
jgi:hypothetical protein